MNKEQAQYIHISFPFREELCSYTFPFKYEKDEEQLPLVTLGYWQGTVDLETHKLLEWEPNFGECYFHTQRICSQWRNSTGEWCRRLHSLRHQYGRNGRRMAKNV